MHYVSPRGNAEGTRQYQSIIRTGRIRDYTDSAYKDTKDTKKDGVAGVTVTGEGGRHVGQEYGDIDRIAS